MNNIYIFNISGYSDSELKKISCLVDGLPDAIREHILKKRGNRLLSIIGWEILSALKEKYNYDLNTIYYGKYGKPYMNNIYFNISHSGKWVIVGISKHEIGVDVETKVFNDIYEILELFSEEERRRIMSYSYDIQIGFKYYWSAKEAWVKKSGIGIEAIINPKMNNDEFEKDKCIQLQLDNESVLSVYSDDKDIVYNYISFSNGIFYY